MNNKRKINWETIVIILGTTVFLMIIAFFAYIAIKYWHLEKELAERGVSTTATIIKCTSNQNTSSALYEYSLVLKNGETKTFQTENVGGGRPTDGCKVGKKRKIWFLPEAPEKALTKKSAYISMSIVGMIVISFTLLSILYEYFRRRNQGHASHRGFKSTK